MKNKNDAIKIEKGIPLPESKYETKNPLVLIMKKMKNGDSFLCSIGRRSNLFYCARKAHIVISTRNVDESQIRVWRIKERPLSK